MWTANLWRGEAVGGGSPLLLAEGEEGAEPAEEERKGREEGERRERTSLTIEGREGEVGEGQEDVGERANTGMEEKWSTGILILT